MRKTHFFLFLFLFILLPSLVFSQGGGKWNIAVLDLDLSGGVPASYQRTLSDRLRQELLNTGKFTVIERNAMEGVLSEQGFQMSGCTSDECAVQVGRLLGVEFITAGSIGKVGTVHTISIRIVDVETGEIKDAKTVDCACPIEEVLTARIGEAARLLAGVGGGASPSGTTHGGKGDLFVKSSPPGAKVYLDDELQSGLTPMSIEKISAGLHTVRLRKGEFVGQSEIFLESGIMNRLEIPLVKGRATVRVFSNPFEAIVYIDGKKVGPTPQTISDLSAGQHSFRLTYPGHVNHDEKVYLKVGEENRLDIDMVKAVAEIAITTPGSATSGRIIINGKSQDRKFPARFSDLKFGEYKIEVKANGHYSFSTTLTLAEPRSYDVYATLKMHTGDITFSRLPNGARVLIDGQSVGHAPLNPIPKPVGTYTVNLSSPGYDGETTQMVEVTKKGVSEVVNNLVAKSHARALLKSALLPGAGQQYLDRHSAGSLYYWAEVGLLGYLGYNAYNYNKEIDAYNVLVDEYRTARNRQTATAKGLEMNEAFGKVEDAEKKWKSAMVYIIGVYVINLADAMFWPTPGQLSKPGHASISQPSFHAGIQPDSRGKPVGIFGVGMTMDLSGRASR
ncbi:MAG: PEGA domain-containing protein [Candidatus Electryonea clarkiae]|nr:PEGA domain-containing protein [Candidatus Electryonea clarkiae]MDP8286701.1 PEGA domain-containing protein [Candidatus Electryonea clarkiae]